MIVAKFLFPDWGDIVDSGIGLSYRPARLHIGWRAGRTTLCQSRLYIPQSGTKNLASGDSILSPLLPGVQKRRLRRCICTSGSGSLLSALTFDRWSLGFQRTVSKKMYLYFWIRINAHCSYLCSLVLVVQKDGV